MSTRLWDMNIPKCPLLPEDETRPLIIAAQGGDIDARDKLVNSNLRLVLNLIQRFFNRGYEPEDLFQIGTIGLIKAIDKFDLTYDVRFSTYAVPMILGEIRRFLRDDNPVKVSRSVKEIATKANHMRERLTRELGREPALNEISQALAIPREEIVNAMEASQMPSSIFDTLYQDDGDPIYVLDQLASEKSDGDPGWFDQLALREVIRKLEPRERIIIIMRFFQDKTQTQIAEYLGLSQVQVSRLERQTLKKIKSLLDYQEKAKET